MMASARKIKRTKREDLRQVESLNANEIVRIYGQISNLQTAIEQIIHAVTGLQVVVSVLQKKGIINDLEISLEMQRIRELEEMAKKATVIEPDRKEKDDEKRLVNA